MSSIWCCYVYPVVGSQPYGMPFPQKTYLTSGVVKLPSPFSDESRHFTVVPGGVFWVRATPVSKITTTPGCLAQRIRSHCDRGGTADCRDGRERRALPGNPGLHCLCRACLSSAVMMAAKPQKPDGSPQPSPPSFSGVFSPLRHSRALPGNPGLQWETPAWIPAFGENDGRGG